MPKYIAVVESWGDMTNYLDYIQNKNFEYNPIEIIANTKRTVWVSSVEDMVNKVISAAGGSKIWWLVILGHGFPGWQSIGCGKDTNSDSDSSKHLWVESTTGKLAGNAETYLERLKPIFAPNAVVSLLGCKTGAGTKGELLLKTVSNVLGGIRVEAGTMTQFLLPGFEGPVRSCKGNTCTIYPCSKLEESAVRKTEELKQWVDSF